MDPVAHHAFGADVSFDGGDLDCGNGLLLLIRKHVDPLAPGQLLEILSTDSSVESDLPAWCRLTGNELVSWTRSGRQRSFLVCKGPLARRAARPASASDHAVAAWRAVTPTFAAALPSPASAPVIAPLSVMGIGSWPRPRWMTDAIQAHISGSLQDDRFHATADDAVRLAVAAQERAGADVVSDGEQRRDSYASFVGGILDNCQPIPLADLAAMVDDADEFTRELRALDVPAREVRHPVALGPIGRSRPLAMHLRLVKQLTSRPIKIALPGPYLLTRTMWLECLAERAYASREQLARDLVRVLREELCFLLNEGAALVQLDEPVLTEVVFSGPTNRRTFMCGALSAKGEPGAELEFAVDLVNQVVAGLPAARLALHVCRGNWTKDESALLSGDYRPLLGALSRVHVGTVFLELSTSRAGELEVLAELPDDKRIGVGVLNPRADRVESADEIAVRARRAIGVFGRERVLLTPDCGFATFALHPVSSAPIAEAKLQAVVRARDLVHARR
ncbi:MAG: sulfurtransferase TusA family protein [Planctomycetota bacterium]